MSEKDMVGAFAKAQGYHVAIKKNTSSSRSDYGFASSESMVKSYLDGSDCPNPKIVYDDGKRESLSKASQRPSGFRSICRRVQDRIASRLFFWRLRLRRSASHRGSAAIDTAKSPSEIMRVTRETLGRILEIREQNPLSDIPRKLREKWRKYEQEWGKTYEGRRVKLVKSPANDFFSTPRPESDIGRCGRLCRFGRGANPVFEQNQAAWFYGCSGVEVYVTFDNGETSLALLEEIEFIQSPG
ncbi:MAG: hypothetical protein QGH94_09650 [Phycisphaerae bacterium]|jgi:hypothetical protein|nr:hypothetical protein [Phycisphaerae bacterium]